jgi:hemolysin III
MTRQVIHIPFIPVELFKLEDCHRCRLTLSYKGSYVAATLQLLFCFSLPSVPPMGSTDRYDGPVQPTFRLGDILANAITHGVGALLAIAGAIYLIAASMRGSNLHVLCCTVFSVTLVLVYLCSTLYHSLVRTGARHVFQILDHASIYLLIAGTYTPFTLISLRGPVGWTLFAIVWTLAVAGIIFKSFAIGRFEVLSALVYLFQGWVVIFAAHPLLAAIGWHGVYWLGAGGLAYTLGIVFFALDRLRYFHATWHIFVLAGSVAHYFAILFYVVPARP